MAKPKPHWATFKYRRWRVPAAWLKDALEAQPRCARCKRIVEDNEKLCNRCLAAYVEHLEREG